MNEKKPANAWTKSLLIWVGVLFGLVLFVQMIDGGARPAPGQAIAYSDFIKQVDQGSVRGVTMATTTTGGGAAISGKLANGQAFRTTAPADAKVSDRLIAKGVAVQVKAEEPTSLLMALLLNSLPFMLILGVSFFVFRQMQKNSGSGAMGFGKSRARMLTARRLLRRESVCEVYTESPCHFVSILDGRIIECACLRRGGRGDWRRRRARRRFVLLSVSCGSGGRGGRRDGGSFRHSGYGC